VKTIKMVCLHDFQLGNPEHAYVSIELPRGSTVLDAKAMRGAIDLVVFADFENKKEQRRFYVYRNEMTSLAERDVNYNIEKQIIRLRYLNTVNHLWKHPWYETTVTYHVFEEIA